ncbi:uncharacterized protein QC763_0031390 [Podospora pseudopauciseta]|uniref:Uncharacterized protein n=1 Tax=Podospora pseudopauciseta TaxID=2093780 RepID=A0ABR0HMN8_9PEZI|nr:hypothetical protein QC763_0031390 [Podospora pseudopauciseta]
MFTLLTCKTGNIYKYTFSPLIFILSLSLSWESSKYPISHCFVHSPPSPAPSPNS